MNEERLRPCFSARPKSPSLREKSSLKLTVDVILFRFMVLLPLGAALSVVIIDFLSLHDCSLECLCSGVVHCPTERIMPNNIYILLCNVYG